MLSKEEKLRYGEMLRLQVFRSDISDERKGVEEKIRTDGKKRLCKKITYWKLSKYPISAITREIRV